MVFESNKLQLRYVTKTRFAQLPGFSDVIIAIRQIFFGEKNGINCLLSLMNRPKTEINIQELSYRQQIARKLHTQYAEGILRVKCYTVTLKSRLKITQGHWIQNNWIDHIISYHLDLLRRHSSNVQQRRTIQ